jgi:hypothetical protein
MMIPKIIINVNIANSLCFAGACEDFWTDKNSNALTQELSNTLLRDSDKKQIVAGFIIKIDNTEPSSFFYEKFYGRENSDIQAFLSQTVEDVLDRVIKKHIADNYENSNF